MRLKGRNLTVLVLLMGFTISLAAAPPKIIKQVVQGADAVRSADYWTPERRASAIPLDVRGVDLGAAAVEELAAAVSGPRAVRSSGGPTVTTETAPEVQNYWSPESAASPAQADDLGTAAEPLASDFNRFKVVNQLYKGPARKFPYIAVGRLFMRFSGVNYSCSAAVISPGRLVVTARNCIFDNSKGGFADVVNFFPGYQNGYNPDLAGGWTARVLLTFDTGGQRFNIGILQMFNYAKNGCKAKANSPQILSFTGFLGTFQGGTYTNATALTLFGYPAVAPPAEFDGKFMHQCNSAQKGINKGGNAGTIEVGCDFTGGANGGPWIHTFKPDQNGANNFLRSLTTHRLAGAANQQNLEGPQLQADNFGALLNAAINEACP